ncbi:hypothetical protein [Leifsonia sp. Leaf336]|uniref:hypothetical protein n=1 Tax=Leifsonia sp. Leaf336 TaxID=1736341 RepID=UPI00138F7A37|nr:hypothetical protein [Leifsonia sp. Leaf336]
MIDDVVVGAAMVLVVEEIDPVRRENKPTGMSAVLIQSIGCHFRDRFLALRKPVRVALSMFNHDRTIDPGGR